MPKVFASHIHWYSFTINSLKSLSPKSFDPCKKPLKLVYTYDNIIHGLGALLSNAELESLRKSQGLVFDYIDRNVTLDTTHTFEFLSLNPVTGLWPASQYGKDVILGVIDAGVWPESLSFKDDGND
ncbi:UNVERIFIED_CONTAM: Subtilisin-like protease SBT3 [Sesamum calycinum]|uniref:Subtilisin-like protease SBT3 n=1 Tax=Sesamum calycinum TaxID=2727403 RepID=A0AAW2QN57_9LAMI